MLSSLHRYSEFVYKLPDAYPSIQRFQLVLSSRGATIGRLEGTVKFDHGVVLRVLERLDFARRRIMYYSYEVRREEKLLYWYDPWPHPRPHAGRHTSASQARPTRHQASPHPRSRPQF